MAKQPSNIFVINTILQHFMFPNFLWKPKHRTFRITFNHKSLSSKFDYTIKFVSTCNFSFFSPARFLSLVRISRIIVINGSTLLLTEPAAVNVPIVKNSLISQWVNPSGCSALLCTRGPFLRTRLPTRVRASGSVSNQDDTSFSGSHRQAFHRPSNVTYYWRLKFIRFSRGIVLGEEESSVGVLKEEGWNEKGNREGERDLGIKIVELQMLRMGIFEISKVLIKYL